MDHRRHVGQSGIQPVMRSSRLAMSGRPAVMTRPAHPQPTAWGAVVADSVRPANPGPTVVEIIGPAGAGKSALADGLLASTGWVTTGLSLWNLPRRFLLASGVTLMPRVTAATVAARGLLHTSAVAQMLRIGALERAVEHEEMPGTDLVVLDEGPVFGLTWLDVFFSLHRSPEWAAWRRATIARWAQRLQVIVSLDADDALLVHRIRTRAKHHPVKYSEDHEIHAFTARFRQSFERVVRDFRAANLRRVMKVRTDDITPDVMAVRLRAVLDGRTNGR